MSFILNNAINCLERFNSMNNDITVSIYNGKSKKTGKNFQAIKLEIGDWSTLVFPRSSFELNYIKNVLENNNE